MSRRWQPLLLLLMLLAATPALAAEPVASLPAVRASNSGRFDLAVAINDLTLIVGKGEVASATRAHFVLKLLPLAAGMGETTIEIVEYDGTTYTRLDDDPQWYRETQTDLPVAAPVGQPAVDPAIDVSSAQPYSIGAVDVAGTPTDQFQLWINKPASDVDYLKIDLFVGRQINYLSKLQLTTVGTDPDLGAIKLETVTRLYDFDAANIVVGPPRNAIAAPGAARGLMPALRGAGLVGTLLAPLSSQRVRSSAVARLAH